MCAPLTREPGDRRGELKAQFGRQRGQQPEQAVVAAGQEPQPDLIEPAEAKKLAASKRDGQSRAEEGEERLSKEAAC